MKKQIILALLLYSAIFVNAQVKHSPFISPAQANKIDSVNSYASKKQYRDQVANKRKLDSLNVFRNNMLVKQQEREKNENNNYIKKLYYLDSVKNFDKQQQKFNDSLDQIAYQKNIDTQHQKFLKQSNHVPAKKKLEVPAPKVQKREIKPLAVAESTISHTKTDALMKSWEYVKHNIKSPATADFPWNADNVTQLTFNSFLVKSYFDAQNSFGAMLRANYTCKITFTIDNATLCENLIIKKQ